MFRRFVLAFTIAAAVAGATAPVSSATYGKGHPVHPAHPLHP